MVLAQSGTSPARSGGPIDSAATAETRALFENLRPGVREGILFGHHHTTSMGVGWRWEKDRSDVRTLVGDYPAVHGWDFRHINVNLAQREGLILEQIIAAFERGAVLTMSWHMPNPVSGGAANDVTPATATILPGGNRHEQFVRDLDRFADFVKKLRTRDGRAVPVIFRPWHEHTGSFFWWGQKVTTKEEFVALWRFTVTHLRDTRGVRQLLWAYSPNRIATPATYFERYPGDEWVDVLGFDAYGPTGYLPQSKPSLEFMVAEARRRGKIAAFTETGPRDGLKTSGASDYYTKELLAFLRDPALRGLAYVLLWHNQSEEQFWVPQPGDPWSEDFKAFYADPFTWFERGLADLYSRRKAQ